MRWDRGHQSEHVEDRRGESGGAGHAGAVGILFFLFRHFGVGGAVLGALVLGGFYLFSGGGAAGLSGTEQAGSKGATQQDSAKAFVGFVLDDIQATWAALYRQRGEVYRPARLVLFSSRIDSACGFGSAATGPFYCPPDQRVYIDLSFYQALRERLGAPGDFAQAYVIAHEVGHHVTHLQQRLSGARGEGADGASVRVELQADCYAGVWAHSAKQRQLLEVGDFQEAMRAAEAIGDDALQRKAGGTVQPESFTHGTSAQRMRWFKKGFESGRPEACDTLNASQL